MSLSLLDFRASRSATAARPDVGLRCSDVKALVDMDLRCLTGVAAGRRLGVSEPELLPMVG